MNSDKKPFFVAEMSCNHLGSLDRALAIVDAAADAGADAVKLQTWDRMCMPGYIIKDGPWKGRELSALYDEAKTPWEWHVPIFNRCRERGIVGFSAPFDLESLDFLESINCPMYKIASLEITDLLLVQEVARRRKPMIISTGAANSVQIANAVYVARAKGATSITLMKCTSAYPAPMEDCNLRAIHALNEFNVDAVGFSDHTLGLVAPVTATAFGATVIEKHLTLLRSDGGPDAEFSAEPQEFAAMVQACKQAYAALGSLELEACQSEDSSRKLRRSLWVVQDIKKGECFAPHNLRSLRPGDGMDAANWFIVAGKKATRNIKAGTPLQKHMVK